MNTVELSKAANGTERSLTSGGRFVYKVSWECGGDAFHQGGEACTATGVWDSR